MVRPMPRINGENLCISMPLTIGLFLSILALITLCAKHGQKSSKSMSTEKPKTYESKIVPKLSPPLRIPNKKNNSSGEESDGEVVGESGHGLWQKAIMMGEKCQPPEFSGVIYYDPLGNRVSELPRSPRASPMPRYASERQFG